MDPESGAQNASPPHLQSGRVSVSWLLNLRVWNRLSEARNRTIDPSGEILSTLNEPGGINWIPLGGTRLSATPRSVAAGGEVRIQAIPTAVAAIARPTPATPQRSQLVREMGGAVIPSPSPAASCSSTIRASPM